MTTSVREIDSAKVFSGKYIEVVAAEFEYDDGSTSLREWVAAGPCACALAYDENYAYLVSQPREPIGEPNAVEAPAGGVEDGEDALACAKRELAEEVGVEAANWEHVRSVYTSPGTLDEICHLYIASELKPVVCDGDDGERIEVVKLPLDQVENEARRNRDLKTIVLLEELARRLCG